MILCCGEALIDFVPTADGAAYRPVTGGSIFNIAIGLGRLGAPVGYFGKVSTDFFGDRLVQTLSDNGVDTSLVVRAPGPTTLAFVDLAVEGGREPRYSFYAAAAADRSLSADELPERLPSDIRALHFGSISLVLEPSASSLEGLMQREADQRLISLDPNVRPGLIPDRDHYRTRFEGWTEQADIIRLSRADFEWLYPDQPAERVIQSWFGHGVSLAILTSGAAGATGFLDGGATAFMPSMPVDIVDSVGAGDSFLAASLFYLNREGILQSTDSLRRLTVDSLKACLAFATRAAALTCSRPGADPPYAHELESEASR